MKLFGVAKDVKPATKFVQIKVKFLKRASTRPKKFKFLFFQNLTSGYDFSLYFSDHHESDINQAPLASGPLTPTGAQSTTPIVQV